LLGGSPFGCTESGQTSTEAQWEQVEPQLAREQQLLQEAIQLHESSASRNLSDPTAY